jgi:acyl dehydratase
MSTQTTANDFEVRITEDALEALRAKIGSVRRTREEPNLEEAGKDAIRHWVRAIGDQDPKWTDESYALDTPFGGITAPPSMLYGFTMQAIGDRSGLPGIHSFFGGADHEWYKPIRRNDHIEATVVLTGVEERQSKFARRSVVQTSEVTWTNQRDEVVARSWPYGLRTERDTAAREGKYSSLERATYTVQEIEEISETYSREPSLIRGPVPRYWEDVAVGDSLGPLIRGPWTASISIRFLGAIGGLFMKTHGYWYEYLQAHPRAGIRNEYGVPEGPPRGHWDNEFARRVGVPGAYDYGPERIAWLCSLATYWCGDAGWLRSMKAEILRFNLQGDLTTISGRVVEKRDEEQGKVAICELSATDQRGEVTARATAIMELPSRHSDVIPALR